MGWKKESLLNILSKREKIMFFDENYGVSKWQSYNFSVCHSKDKHIDFYDIYVKKGAKYVRFCETIRIRSSSLVSYIKGFFDNIGIEIFTNVNGVFKKGTLLAPFKITVSQLYLAERKEFVGPEQFDFIINEYQDLNDTLYYVYDDDLKNLKFVNVKLDTIDVGKKYYLLGHGEVEVVKQFEYPNISGLVMKVKDCKGKIHQLKSNETIFYLPYEYKNEIGIFNDCKNELALHPILIRNNNVFNLFWGSVDSAARYIVKIYKIYPNNKFSNLYHMKDFEIERSQCYFSIADLIGDNFVFVIEAEDRDGKIVAKCRGIRDGFPTFWEE